MKQAVSLFTFTHPKYWPVWLGLGLIYGINQLPFTWQIKTGHLLGKLSYLLAKKRRSIAQRNIELCFPSLSKQARKKLLKENFASMGIALIETGLSWWAPNKKLQSLVHISGLENLQHALAENHGAILLSCHFTTLEIGGRLLALKAPFHIMYRTHKNALFEEIMRRARERNYEKAIPRDDIRSMLKSFKKNMPVWYAPDQNYGREHSIFVPFFGIQAATITATSRIAKMGNTKVVPFFQSRKKDNSGYEIKILPALENFPSENIENDTLRINQLIENEITKIPEQYLWAHRRFKTRPEGETPLY